MKQLFDARFCLLAVVFLYVAGILGCAAHGQIPPSPPPTVALTWTASASCSTANPCVYVVSRASCTSTCPGTSGTSYTQITVTAANATSFTDNTATGSVGYIVQAQTTGTPPLVSQPSGVSNNGVPIAVPTLPLAPGAPNGTATAKNAPEPTFEPEGSQVVASMKSPGDLRAILVRR